MKRLRIHQLIYSKHVLKCYALIFGCLYWHISSQNYLIEKLITVPVYVYETNENYNYTIPEHINVYLKAKRKDFLLLDDNLSIHLDGRTLKPGENYIPTTTNNLFLPSSISIVCCKPSSLFVMVSNINTM